MYFKLIAKMLMVVSIFTFLLLNVSALQSNIKSKTQKDSIKKLTNNEGLISRSGVRPKNLTQKEVQNLKSQLFLQFDERWGSKPYSINPDGKDDKGIPQTIANSGCGPTSFFMVANHFGESNKTVDLNRDGILTPDEICEYSTKKGFRTNFSGTDGRIFEDLTKEMDLKVTVISPYQENLLRDCLLNDGIAIASMHKGSFTNDLHYIVLDKINNDKIFLRDPASEERSAISWDLNSVLNEANVIWLFSKSN